MEPWRTDRQLQNLIEAFRRITPHVMKGPWQFSPENADWLAAQQAIINYIDYNRGALGIPDGMYVSPTTYELYKPEGTPWLKFGLIYGGGLLGGLLLAGAIPGIAGIGAGAGASTGGASTTGVVAGSSAAAAITGVVTTVGVPVVATLIHEHAETERQEQQQAAAAAAAARQGAGASSLFGGIDTTTLLICAAIVGVAFAVRH